VIMKLNTIYRKKPDVVTRQIAGETLLVPIRSQLADMQRIFALNSSAEFIWNNLDGKQNLAEILEGMGRHFDVQKEQAGADLRDFIGQLKEAGVIEELDG
jgi:hypothetical protein